MRGDLPIGTVVTALILATACNGCGTSKRRAECEKLEDRLVEISLAIAQDLQKLGPPDKRLDRDSMEALMREKLDRGTFMEECMKLDPEEVRCVSGARTQEEWKRCGFGDVSLP